jgi:hypothetical protein
MGRGKAPDLVEVRTNAKQKEGQRAAGLGAAPAVRNDGFPVEYKGIPGLE